MPTRIAVRMVFSVGDKPPYRGNKHNLVSNAEILMSRIEMTGRGGQMDDLRVAAVCMHSEPGEVGKNLERMQALAFEASSGGAHIVCFPELSVTGYVLKQPASVYNGLPHEKAVERLIRIAQEAGLVLMAGLIEFYHDKKPFITHVIVGPNGLIGSYRKTHLSPAEKNTYQAGQEIEVYRVGNTIFGVELCYETHFPEISTVLALMGADILFLPHASPRGNARMKLQSWLRHLPSRAFDTGTYVVACNQIGSTAAGFTFPGVAVVLGPDGKILARYTGEDERILLADLKAEKLHSMRRHRMKYFLPQRRPELYHRLVKS